ncbi:MAG TPA: hypothetical protein VM554_07960 [Acidisarcina sp.]|nr:hypothetical protein [Acidisarcina sp.]
MNSIAGYSAPLKPISAVDALVPAFRRTRSILAAPFRLGFFLKICFFVALAESGFLSAAISYPVRGANAFPYSRAVHLHPATNFLADGWGIVGALSMGLLLLFAVVAILGIALLCVALYLLCRLRLTVLDLAIYRQGLIRKAWSRYRQQTWRYFGITLLAGLAFLLMFAAVIGPFLPAFIRIARTTNASSPDSYVMFRLLLPFLGAILALSFLGVLVDAVIRDFLLPPMAIEDASIESALARFFGVLRSGMGSTVLYLFLRTVISTLLSACLGIVLVIPVALLGLLAYAGGAVLYHSLWMGGAQFLFLIYVAAAATVLLLLYFSSMVTVFGVTGVFKLCYAVIYFGARYPALGALLESQFGATPIPPEPRLPRPPGDLPMIEPPPVW